MRNALTTRTAIGYALTEVIMRRALVLGVVGGIAVAMGCGNKAAEPSRAAGSGSSAAGRGSAAGSGSATGGSGAIASGSAAAAAPAAAGASCLPSDGERSFASFTADDRSATLCTAALGDDNKDERCLAVDFASGTWRTAVAPRAAPAPAKPSPATGYEVRQDAHGVSVCRGETCTKLKLRAPSGADGSQSSYLAAVSDDGKRAVIADDSLKGAAFFDATTGKRVRTLKLTAGGGCMDTVDFLDQLVYIAVNVCAGPGAEGKFYSWAGKVVGELGTVNPYGAPPIHLSGTSYAFADLNGLAIEVVDSRTARTRALSIPEGDDGCDDCYPLGASPLGGSASLIKTRSGKLVDLTTRSIALVDPTATRIEKQFPFPLCPRPKQP